VGRLRKRGLVLRQAQDEVAKLLIFLILSLSKNEGNRADPDLRKGPLVGENQRRMSQPPMGGGYAQRMR
jgi:hypothetical protein